ncbi:putative phosphohydrolases, Icc family [hydrothermal vent metagenome]|uniref:Putative phosphohydrolases, Icc family n=1 Tax=hydrothermal vent metagenome TaxID=652676 RepID=A0A3B0UFH9_9ZZZZ
MNTIAHISDIHLAPLPKIRPTDLMSKRITGYLNWKLKRGGVMSSEAADHLVDHLLAQRPDMTAITGDLVNLALDDEMAAAKLWLKRLGPPEQVCLVPGNHDAYVPGALDAMRKIYGPYATGETLDQNPFPFVRRIGQVAIIGCSSALATPPFIAAGYFGRPQAQRLAKCLDILGKAGFYRTVLIHHPPNVEFKHPWRNGLFGAKLFRKTIAEHGAEMVLHGHTHASSVHLIKGPDKSVPVIGVAAASTAPGSARPPARYNLFQIKKLSNGWSCTMREFGYQRIGDNIVQRLQLRVH